MTKRRAKQKEQEAPIRKTKGLFTVYCSALKTEQTFSDYDKALRGYHQIISEVLNSINYTCEGYVKTYVSLKGKFDDGKTVDEYFRCGWFNK